jgi:hypothetical protein
MWHYHHYFKLFIPKPQISCYSKTKTKIKNHQYHFHATKKKGGGVSGLREIYVEGNRKKTNEKPDIFGPI